MNLYNLTNEMLELQDILESEEIENELLSSIFKSYDDEFEKKAEDYAKVIRSLELDIEAVKSEEKRLAEKRKMLASNVEKLKSNLKQAMILTGKKKFKSGIFNFSIVKNGGKQPLWIDEECKKDPRILPEEFRIAEWKIDTDSIREALKTEKLPFAQLLEREENLRIK